jgi:Cu-processing system permease protein
MRAIAVIAWNSFREARRDRVNVVLGAFAVILLSSSFLLTELTSITVERVVTDFGLGTMTLLLVGLAVYLACGMLPREVERKTVFLVVTRPLTRSAFFVGRYLGNMLSLGLMLVSMTLVLSLQFYLSEVPWTQPRLLSVAGLFLELGVLTAMGMFLSAFAGQVTSAVTTAGLYFAGHLADEIYRTAERSDAAGVSVLGKVVYYLVPNLERVNFKTAAAHGTQVPWSTFGSGAGLTLGYILVFLALGAFIFERRDFK